MNPKSNNTNRINTYTIFADGGSRGNPWDAAYGFVIFDSNKKKVFEHGAKIGINTNNVAEYSGIVAALKWVEENLKGSVESINFFLDSQLAAMQLSGKWKIKNENLRSLFFAIKEFER